MTIEIDTLGDISPTLIQQNLTEVSSRVQELFPELDLKRGVFHDVVLVLHAILAGVPATNISRYLSARSLQQIEADPLLADDDVVDHVLSNWRLTRNTGAKASGRVTIVLSDANGITISNGTTMMAGGQTFTTTQAWTARDDAGDLATPSDVLLTQLSDGTYAFIISVEAALAGEDGNIPKDTLVLLDYTPSNFVTAYATDDFTGGGNVETNDELLQRMQEGIAGKTISNRVTMRGWLRDMEAYSRISHQSIIGYGDTEMLRDQHSLVPVSFGGRVDWYIRTQPQLVHLGLSKEASLVEKTTDGRGIWQFAVLRTEMAGAYEVRNIFPSGSTNVVGGFEITEDIRGLDLTDEGFKPDLEEAVEGVYTAYQTLVIRFKDTETVTSELDLGATQDYVCEAVGVPLLSAIQTTVNHRDYRSYGADALIKAPVPCFLQLTFTIHQQTSESPPDETAIKSALCEVVNATPFTGRLYASHLHDTIHAYLSNASSVGAIDMFGRIRRPNGTTLYLRDDTVLTVPDESALMVTPKTVQFFLDPADISITVQTSIPQAD